MCSLLKGVFAIKMSICYKSECSLLQGGCSLLKGVFAIKGGGFDIKGSVRYYGGLFAIN